MRTSCRGAAALLILGVAAVATAGTFVIDLVNYQSFLYLLGSFSCRSSACCSRSGSRASATPSPPRVRPGQIVAWLAGSCLYQWLAPVGPSSWTASSIHTPGQGAIGGSLPSFALAFVLSSAWSLRGSCDRSP